MSQNSSVFISVLKNKCPKCHQGNLFSNKTIYQYKGFFDMPNNCPKCKQDFLIEAGFYLGAMFVSYALNVAIAGAVFVAFNLFDAYEFLPFLIVAGICLTLSTPFILKVSRSIWIAFSVPYDPNAIKNYEAQNKNN